MVAFGEDLAVHRRSSQAHKWRQSRVGPIKTSVPRPGAIRWESDAVSEFLTERDTPPFGMGAANRPHLT